jgi:hypothetical protein
LNVKDGIRAVSLGEDHFFSRKGQDLPAIANGRQKDVGVEFAILPEGSRGSHDQQLYS